MSLNISYMKNTRPDYSGILSQVEKADVTALRQFLSDNPSKPLVATGSGGAETVADFAALLYGARGGVATAASPYTIHSLSDRALASSKVLLVSAGGHNNDIVFAAKRALEVSPESSASFTFSTGERNEVRKLFLKNGSPRSFDIPVSTDDGFVSTGTPVAFFALLCKAFGSCRNLTRFAPEAGESFSICTKSGRALTPSYLKGVSNFVILHGSWGRPVAANLEGKLVESGHASASVYDYRNYCHGRFIYTSNHLSDSAVVLLVTPREKDLAGRIVKLLPDDTRLIIIETREDAPVASLDLLIRSTEFFFALCDSLGVNPASPKNPGKIDKRVPMWIPFISAMKQSGPLSL